MVHGMTEFEGFCMDCGKIVDSAEDLAAHMVEHKKPEHTMYVCLYCGLALAQKDQLQEHQQEHSGKKRDSKDKKDVPEGNMYRVDSRTKKTLLAIKIWSFHPCGLS